MIFYIIGALIKLIVGMLILSLTFFYINPFQDPVVGLSFGFLGIFLIIWGAFFFFLLLLEKLFTKRQEIHKLSKNYKISLLFSLFVLINLGFILLQQWNKVIGIILVLVFIFLHILLNNDK